MRPRDATFLFAFVSRLVSIYSRIETPIETKTQKQEKVSTPVSIQIRFETTIETNNKKQAPCEAPALV